MIYTARVGVAAALAAAALALTACGGPTGAATSPTPAAAPTSAAASPGGTATAKVSAKVSANSASEDEIAAALTAAGVSNAGRWAGEVVEYRPYPADDPNLGSLRQKLAKYNPGEDTVNKIVSALAP